MGWGAAVPGQAGRGCGQGTQSVVNKDGREFLGEKGLSSPICTVPVEANKQHIPYPYTVGITVQYDLVQ